MPKLSSKKKIGLQMLAEGKTVPEVAQALGVNVQAVYKWKAKAKHEAWETHYVKTQKPATVEEITKEIELNSIPEDASEALKTMVINEQWQCWDELRKLRKEGNVTAITYWDKKAEQFRAERGKSNEKEAPTINFNLTVKPEKSIPYIDVTPKTVDAPQLEAAKPQVTVPEFVDDFSGLVPVKAIQDDAPAA